MKSLWKYVIIQILLPTAWTLYHEPSILKFVPPESLQENAYFGYSITYQPKSERLIISAPRADNIGHVYSCDISTKTCTHIPTNIVRENSQYQHDYWFGATVKAGPSYFVSCAPRYTGFDQTYNLIGTFGRCYQQGYNNSDEFETLPSITINNRVKGTNTFEQTVDSFGWSIDVATDGSVLVGGPAMFTGRVMSYPSLTQTPTGLTGVNSQIKYNYGYSVASGHFLSEHILLHAIGSPYGRDGSGEVKIFKDVNKKVLRKISQPADLGQVGAMFGAVLCTAQISGRLTDLLVGAPTYAREHSYDNGAVFVYVKFQFKRLIVGEKYGSYFGSAVVSVGDLNRDGKDEIAIAAPYEDDGRGAVYLYSGKEILQGKLGKPFGWVQRIQPEGYRAFGLGLSAVQDYDKNGCYELAIGAPGNDAVALLKCMAAITINMTAKFPDLQNRNKHRSDPNINATYFKFQSCIITTYPEKPAYIIASISVKVELFHPNAALADPASDSAYTVDLDKNKSIYCRDVGVSLPLNGNYDLKMHYKLSASLLDSPVNRTEFNESRVILSDDSKLIDLDYVSAAECKNKESCAPELEGEIHTTMGSPYIIGSKDMENVSVVLRNKPEGDTAYESCVSVRAVGAFVQSAPAACRRLADRVTCAPPEPLHANSVWNTGNIVLKTAMLTNKDQNISIYAEVYNNCKDDDHVKVPDKVITLVPDSSGIHVKGKSNLGNLVNITRHEVKYTGKQIEHRYRITNNGPTNWEGAKCNILLPKKSYIKYSVKPVSALTFDSREMNCTIHKSSNDQILSVCDLDRLQKGQPISVNVAIDVEPGKLEDIIDKENVTIYTNISVELDTKTIASSVKTTLMLYDVSVPLWIIIVATLVGFMVLVIIGLVLRECGFLRRKNQEKLKELRKSIRRQTMRRSMMPPAEREKLVERADEAAEMTSCGDHTNDMVEVLPTSVKFTK